MGDRGNHTSPQAEKLQIEIFRRMEPEKHLRSSELLPELDQTFLAGWYLPKIPLISTPPSSLIGQERHHLQPEVPE